MGLRVCILDNDQLDGTLARDYQSFAAMFAKLFAQAGVDWDLDAFSSMQGHVPARLDAYDAVLLTGSGADAFANTPWIVQLRRRVHAILAAQQPLIGVCFGHQLIAHCLGAPVGRAPQGWGVGLHHYTWHTQAAPTFAPGERMSLLASHQDQVFALPTGASLVASSAFCPVATFQIGARVFCVQPHPEFDPEFSRRLLEKRRPDLSEKVYQHAMSSLTQPHAGVRLAHYMAQFLQPTPS